MKKMLKKLVELIKAKLKLIIILVLVITAGTFIFYKKSQTDKVTLNFEHPVKEDLTKTLEVSGVINAKEKAIMRFVAGGKVVYLGAQEGDWVKKWQTIATIDRQTLEKQLKQDLNNYMKERWDWDQTQDDIKDRWIDKEEERTVDQAGWDLENEILDVEIKDIAIANTTMSAPFAGILVSSPTDVAGVQLLATDAFELVNPSSLVFKAEVDEADIALVRPGLTGKINLDAYPDQEIESYVNFIAYKSSLTTTGTVFLVEFPILEENALDKYRLGMNGDIKIELATKTDVLTIPLIATREREGEIYVDVKTGEDTYEERKIAVGMETNEKVEILDGLSE
jgi:RND family efflux transporter MFP subunit